VCVARTVILWDLEQRWIDQIEDNVRRILCIGQNNLDSFSTLVLCIESAKKSGIPSGMVGTATTTAQRC